MGCKMSLKIQLADENKWLFSKVDRLHGAKVTWKQISKYLKKMIAVRDEMRDFFEDNARDRDFEENKAEIINGINENVETVTEQTQTLEEKSLNELQSITKRLIKLENKMNNSDDMVQKKQNPKTESLLIKIKGNSGGGQDRQISLAS